VCSAVLGRADAPVRVRLDACGAHRRARNHVIAVATARDRRHRVRGVVAGGAAAVR
jgi:hypothetical protein